MSFQVGNQSKRNTFSRHSRLLDLRDDLQKDIMRDKEAKLLRILQENEARKQLRLERLTGNNGRNDSAPIHGSAKYYDSYRETTSADKLRLPQPHQSSFGFKPQGSPPSNHRAIGGQKIKLKPLDQGQGYAAFNRETPLGSESGMQNWEPKVGFEQSHRNQSDSSMKYKKDFKTKQNRLRRWEPEAQDQNSRTPDQPLSRRPLENISSPKMPLKFVATPYKKEDHMAEHKKKLERDLEKRRLAGERRKAMSEKRSRESEEKLRREAEEIRMQEDGYDHLRDDNGGEVTNREEEQEKRERTALIAKLEAEERKKLLELEDMKVRHKEEQRKRFGSLAKKYSNDDDDEEDEDGYYDDTDRAPRDEVQPSRKHERNLNRNNGGFEIENEGHRNDSSPERQATPPVRNLPKRHRDTGKASTQNTQKRNTLADEDDSHFGRNSSSQRDTRQTTYDEDTQQPAPRTQSNRKQGKSNNLPFPVGQKSKGARHDSPPVSIPPRTVETRGNFPPDAYPDEEQGAPVRLVPCGLCGRKFAEERLGKHEAVCAKPGKKRKQFDITKQRLADSGAEPYQGRKGRGAKNNPPKKKNDWRSKHKEFIDAIRYAKQVTNYEKSGGRAVDLPPPPPAENADYIQCPHCQRRYNQKAGERHIPMCKDIRAKPKMLVRRR